MEIDQLFQKLEDHYLSKVPFTIYAFPNSTTVVALFQKTNETYQVESFSITGMIMAPFDTTKKSYIIPEQAAERIEHTFVPEHITRESVLITENFEDHTGYLQLVSDTKKALRSERIQKIVVSRKKEIPLKTLNIQTLITRLFSLDPTAFRYMWFHPETGLWCGASPEVLLKTSGLSFSTMALAGTRKIEKAKIADWSLKEVNEQQYVTDAITTNLQKVTSVVKLSKTYTHMAGSVAHLRTDISGVLKNGKATLNTITQAIHPTPAVCGTPTAPAKKFILDHEAYDREFYTGYLGPIDPNSGESHLYVNLRCMKIEENKAMLFVGGGITAESELEDEWQETCNKLQTMLQVVRPFL